jgi:phage protein D/phage baseplate assembly protein gpV
VTGKGVAVTEPFYAPRFDVRISGLRLAADVTNQVLSLVVETNLDLAGLFSITLRNPDNTLLDSALFDLGKTVEIHLGYGNDLKPVFLGEIAAIEPSFPQDGPPVVRVVGYDKSYKLRRNYPKPIEYKFMNDSLIAMRIAAENGLVPIVDPTPGFTEKTIKVGSDMAFLKERARERFFDVYVEWDRLHFQYPRPQTAAHVLEWGKNLSSFSPRISSAGLAGTQIVRGYNEELAQTIVGMALAADFDLDNLRERLGSSAVDLLRSLVREGIRKDTVKNPLDAVKLAQSLLADLLEGMYEGSGACIGIPDLVAGNYIAIRGVGKRFSGTYRLRKVTHRIDGRGFHTEFAITQRSHSSLMGLLRKQLLEEPSPDQAESFYGVVVAEVQDNRDYMDPEPKVPLGRVKVSFPGLSENFTSGWAPCATPMAGKDMGFYALPELGEQVLVAFEHGNLAKPFVIGRLWNVNDKPPADNREREGQNNKRVIKSRAGHTITFDDTPNVSKLVIEDKEGSSITLNAQDGSITISAQRNLTIKAKGTISLEAADGATKITMNAAEVNVT